MVYTLAEIEEIFPIEFNKQHIAWKNFILTYYDARERKSREEWIWDMNKTLKVYNAIRTAQNEVRFKSEADITYFLLRFS